jgi:hypothetical protein
MLEKNQELRSQKLTLFVSNKSAVRCPPYNTESLFEGCREGRLAGWQVGRLSNKAEGRRQEAFMNALYLCP